MEVLSNESVQHVRQHDKKNEEKNFKFRKIKIKELKTVLLIFTFIVVSQRVYQIVH